MTEVRYRHICWVGKYWFLRLGVVISDEWVKIGDSGEVWSYLMGE